MTTENLTAETLVIRQWREDDLATIRKITWDTWIATYLLFIPLVDLRSYFDEHYSIEALRDLLRGEHFRGYLAESEGVPAGYAKANYFPDERRLYMQSLYILPKYQGKGIGRALLSRVEERAREYGLDCIWLGVMSENTEALEWYRRLGFVFPEKAPFAMGNTTIEHLIGYRTIQREE